MSDEDRFFMGGFQTIMNPSNDGPESVDMIVTLRNKATRISFHMDQPAWGDLRAILDRMGVVIDEMVSVNEHT